MHNSADGQVQLTEPMAETWSTAKFHHIGWLMKFLTEKVDWLKNVKKYMKKNAGIFIFDGQNSHTGLNQDTMKNYADEAGLELTRYEHLHGGIYLYELHMKDRS